MFGSSGFGYMGWLHGWGIAASFKKIVANSLLHASVVPALGAASPLDMAKLITATLFLHPLPNGSSAGSVH